MCFLTTKAFCSSCNIIIESQYSHVTYCDDRLKSAHEKTSRPRAKKRNSRNCSSAVYNIAVVSDKEHGCRIGFSETLELESPKGGKRGTRKRGRAEAKQVKFEWSGWKEEFMLRAERIKEKIDLKGGKAAKASTLRRSSNASTTPLIGSRRSECSV